VKRAVRKTLGWIILSVGLAPIVGFFIAKIGASLFLFSLGIAILIIALIMLGMKMIIEN
jgi:hypothetical protein